ncbi:MAG: NTPase protein [Euryarchaeota archaeon]|nr:NTPase protein [Euryarchaeota archaeon]
MRILENLKVEETEIKGLETKNYSESSDKISFSMKYLKDHFLGCEISRENISNPDNLIVKLCDDSPLSQYLHKQFSNDLLKELEHYKEKIDPPSEELQNSLVSEINLLIKGPNLYDEKRFENIKLTDETRKLIKKKKFARTELSRLNKQLIIEAYLDQNLNQKIEDLQESLYQDIDREEPFDIEFKPSKLVKGTVKLGIKSGFPLPMGEIFTDFFGKDDAFTDLLDTVYVNKRHIHIKKIQLVEEFQHSFESIIEEYYGKNNERVVIFIDDLDRCPSETVLEILHSIKLFLDVKNCIFVLGVDRRVVSKIIENKYKDLSIEGDNFLEKMIQLSFNLPPISSDDMWKFVETLGVNGLYADYLYTIIKDGIELNPRKIKRLLNVIELQLKIAYSIPTISEKLKSEETKELYTSLIIEWSIISQEYPKLKHAISNEPEILSLIHKYVTADSQKEKVEAIESRLTTLLKSALKEDKMQELVKENSTLKNLIKAFPSPDIFKDDDVETGKDKGYKVEIEKDIEKVIHFGQVTSTIKGSPEEIENKGPTKEETLEETKIQKEIEKESEEKIVPINENEIRDAINKGKNQFIGINMRGSDLSGLKLDTINFSGADMTNVNLEGAKIIHSNFIGANMTGINLRKTEIKNSRFDKALIDNANFEGAIIDESKFIRAKLNSARFDSDPKLTDHEFTKLTDIDLRLSKLWHASLKGVKLTKVILTDAELFGADLEGAEFSGVNLNNAGLMSTNLQGTKFGDAELSAVNLRNARFNEKTDFTCSHIDSVTTDNLKGSNWEIAKWPGETEDELKRKYGWYKDK